jgi:hypothetical protein
MLVSSLKYSSALKMEAVCSSETLVFSTDYITLYQKIKLFGKQCLQLQGATSSRAGEERGARGSVVVEALCYKPEGSGFDTR